MQSEDDEAARRVEEVLAESNRLILAGNSPLAQVVLGTVPWTGGVGSLLSTLASQRQEARLRSFLIDLVHEVAEARAGGHELDEEFIRTDEFFGLLEGVLEEAARSGDAKRLDYLRRFIRSSTLVARPDVSWIDLFMRYLGRLSGVHIELLHRVYSLQRGYAVRDRLGANRLKNIPVCVGDVGSAETGINLVRVSLSDLSNLGLLADWKLLSGEPGLAPQQCYSMTRNGMLFMRFLLSDWGIRPVEEPLD